MLQEPETFPLELGEQSQRVLSLAGHGRTDKQIAAELGIKPSTVDWHWRTILRRTGAASRTQAVAIGLLKRMDEERRWWTERLAVLETELPGRQVPPTERDALVRYTELIGGFWLYRSAAPPFELLDGTDTAEALGYTHDELMALPVEELVHPDDLPLALKQYLPVVEQKLPYFEWLFRCRAKSGIYKWMMGRTAVDWDRLVTSAIGWEVSREVAEQLIAAGTRRIRPAGVAQ